MDHFEDQFLTESHEPLGISFEEDAKFFDPESAQEADFLQPQQQVEKSIYTDDLVRVYLREMGAVPLLTRQVEVDLARRMERGKLRMQKAISGSALVQLVVLDLADQLRRGVEELDNVVELGDVEEGTVADTKRRGELRQYFADVVNLHKKQLQLTDKLEAMPLSNKSPRKRLTAKICRSKGETSQSIRRIPFVQSKWKQFSKEIDRAVEELNHLSVAPSEGAIMAAPEGARAPLVDGSEDARRHGTQPVMVMRTNQAHSQGERKREARGGGPLRCDKLLSLR